MTVKKIVLKVELHGERTKQKVMKTTSGISGVESVNVDMKDKKLTVTGDIDPIKVVQKLRKLCYTEIVSVGASESEKKSEEKIENIAHAIVPASLSYSRVYYPPPPYYVGTVEEYPDSGCVIC